MATSAFHDLFRDYAVPTLAEWLGQAATYQSGDESAYAVTVIIQEALPIYKVVVDGQAEEQTTPCEIAVADIAGTPLRGDLITTAGLVWTVVSVDNPGTGFWKLELKRITITDKTSRDFKIPR